MKSWVDFQSDLAARRGLTMAADGRVACFGDLREEYAALATGPAIVDRSNRAVLEIVGRDRAVWLHNLTTNVVTTLAPGDGNYAFATNVQGRILFDLNIVVRDDVLWLDLDRCFLEEAIAHFNRYVILEDVVVHDRSKEFVLFGVVGDRAGDVAATLGVSQFAAKPNLSGVDVNIQGKPCLLVRNDFCGPVAFDLHVPIDGAVAFWEALTGEAGKMRATPVGSEAVEIRRIESGIPWPNAEITSEYLPAETMQFDRAVSFQKGCYLGQEVIERMRTRAKVARRLVRLDIFGDTVPAVGANLLRDGAAVGTITSATVGLASGQPVALGYVKTAASEPGTKVLVRGGAGDLDATVAELSPGARTES